MTSSSSSSSSSSQSFDNVVYWALNGYGVTLVDIIINACMFVLGFFIVFLNSIVLDTMLRRQSHVEVLNVLIGSLATADLLNGISLIANLVYNLANYQVHIECLIRLGFIHALVLASVFHLTILTFDRYFKIMRPLVYRQIFTTTNAGITCSLIWFFGLLFAALPAMGWSLDDSTFGTNETDCNSPVCSYFGLLDPNYIRLLVCLAIIPFIIMTVVYCIIYRVARRHAKQIAAQDVAGCPDHRKVGHTWKYTKTVIIIMGLYCICWLPSGVVLMLVTSGRLDHLCVVQRGTVLTYASLLAFINSAVNPVIYAVKLSAVRTRFRAIFCCESKYKSNQKNHSLVFKEGMSVINTTNALDSAITQSTKYVTGLRLEIKELE